MRKPSSAFRVRSQRWCQLPIRKSSTTFSNVSRKKRKRILRFWRRPMATLTANEYQAFARNDLYTFMHRAFRELNPTTPFLHTWHNELLTSKLEACRRGETTRLIINVPPRSLKSHAAAVCFPAFVLGHNPSAQIICASYGQDLANKHSLDCRTVMNSDWYKALFPTRLASQKQSIQEFQTTQKGFRLATSVGGVLT